MKYYLNLLAALAIGLLAVSCGSSTESEEENDADNPELVTIPETETAIADTHPDSYAQLVRSSVESMDSYAFMYYAFAGGFDSYGWTKDGNVYTYSFQGGGESIRYVITEQTDTWKIQFFYTGELDGYNVTNALWYEGVFNKNGKNGDYTIYTFTASDKKYDAIHFTWNTATNGAVTHTLISKDSATDTDVNTYLAVVNADKSGTVQWKIDNVLSWDAFWNVNGSGSMNYYDTDGSITNTFTWTQNP